MPHDDFEIEPVKGLPEALPEGETIFWQGAPKVWELAKASMNIHWVIGYFSIAAVLRGGAVAADLGVQAGIGAASFYVILGAALSAIILLSAWAFAKTTVYTITSHRVGMRIGAALNITLNIPFRWISKADLALAKNGTGSIHLDLKGDTRFSYLVLWPHVRPWVMKRTQPTLRAIPDVANVARILGEAAEKRVEQITSELAVTPPSAQPIAAE